MFSRSKNYINHNWNISRARTNEICKRLISKKKLFEGFAPWDTEGRASRPLPTPKSINELLCVGSGLREGNVEGYEEG